MRSRLPFDLSGMAVWLVAVAVGVLLVGLFVRGAAAPQRRERFFSRGAR